MAGTQAEDANANRCKLFPVHLICLRVFDEA